VVSENVTRVELGARPFTVHTGDGKSVKARSIILATGATPRRLVMPSDDQAAPYFNLMTCAVCDGRHPHFKNKAVAVVGGGDAAMEDAIFLAKTSAPVYLIHRSATFRASPVMTKRARETPGVVFLTWTTVTDAFFDAAKEPKPDGKKRPTTLKHANVLRLARTDGKPTFEGTPDGKELLTVAGLFFAIGHTPTTGLVKGQVALDHEGYIKIKPGTDTETSVAGVHAAGDCQDFKYRQAVRAISSGCEASMNIFRWLNENSA